MLMSEGVWVEPPWLPGQSQALGVSTGRPDYWRTHRWPGPPQPPGVRHLDPGSSRGQSTMAIAGHLGVNPGRMLWAGSRRPRLAPVGSNRRAMKATVARGQLGGRPGIALATAGDAGHQEILGMVVKGQAPDCERFLRSALASAARVTGFCVVMIPRAWTSIRCFPDFRRVPHLTGGFR
jgi:hypothetical protein